MAAPPNCIPVKPAKAPWNLPIGVRAPETITERVMKEPPLNGSFDSTVWERWVISGLTEALDRLAQEAGCIAKGGQDSGAYAANIWKHFARGRSTGVEGAIECAHVFSFWGYWWRL